MIKACLFQNGKPEYVELDQARVPALDAAYLFGDGVYEVIAVINGHPFDLAPHLARLERSLKMVMIEQPLPTPELAAILNKLPEPTKSGHLYLQVSRGAGDKRDFLINEDTKTSFFAYFQEQKLFPGQSTGETSITFPDIRWSLRHVKTTQLMSSRLAKKFAAENDAVEPIYINPDGIVTECGSSNLFIVKNSEIFTHPADSDILAGITRQRLLELTKVNERKFALDELLAADEVFRTSTTQGVRGITNIKIAHLNKETFSEVLPQSIWQPTKSGLYKIGNGEIGKITRDLAAKYINFANSSHDKPAAKTA